MLHIPSQTSDHLLACPPDETHYTKKHDGYSYEDIKAFLEAMTAFILYEKTVEKAFRIPRK